jgi:hypothetical protein
MLMDTLSSILDKLTTAAEIPSRTWNAWKELPSKMPTVNLAYNKVRRELAEVGLLADGTGLDEVELFVAILPSMDEAGYVFDDGLPWWASLSGFKPGAIYLPSDLPYSAYVPGGTMVDVVRHEYAHAWRWLAPEFFEQQWFVKAFGSTYSDSGYSGKRAWLEKNLSRKSLQTSLQRCKTEETKAGLIQREFAKDFVSEYGSKYTCEDFAETFRHYLRYRNSLDRFKARPGVYNKLKAVERAINKTRRQLGL